MATWSEIQDHMRSTYKLQSDEPHAFRMTWRYEDGRTQRIVVRRYQMAGNEMVEFKSPFAELDGADGPDPIELLRENARLPFGAVALAGEIYLVVHNDELAPMTLGTFDLLLNRVASLADQLEKKHVSTDAF